MVAPVLEAPEEELLHQVDARTNRRSIRSIDSHGTIIDIGRVRTTDYEGSREVRGVWLDSNISNKTHSLGAASKQFQVFDHYAVVQPLLEYGFVPRQVDHARGGASFLGIFDLPSHTWEDPITWDLQRFGDPHGDSGRQLGQVTLGLRVRSDLRRGHGVALTMGYFRLVCLNGLTVQILDMGSLRVDHRRFTESTVDEFLKGKAITSPDRLPTAPSRLVEGLIDIVGIEDPTKIAALPRLLREPASKLFKELNHSTRQDLQRQLGDISTCTDYLTVLDLTNAWTNLAQSTRSRWSIYDEADPSVKALRDLVELEAVKAGVRCFEPN